MAEFEQPTISINAGETIRTVKALKPIDQKRSYSRWLQNFGIMFLLLLAAGWGAWKYTGTTANIDDEESIADLEGFDSAPQLMMSPKVNDSSTTRLGEVASLPPLSQNELLSWDSGKLNPPNTNDMADSANVWLTGTIEEAESKEKIELPSRLSGGPNESSILR